LPILLTKPAFGDPVWGDPIQIFAEIFGSRVPGCDVICVILHVAIFTQYWHLMDGWTDIR